MAHTSSFFFNTIALHWCDTALILVFVDIQYNIRILSFVVLMRFKIRNFFYQHLHDLSHNYLKLLSPWNVLSLLSVTFIVMCVFYKGFTNVILHPDNGFRIMFIQNLFLTNISELIRQKINFYLFKLSCTDNLVSFKIRICTRGCSWSGGRLNKWFRAK